MTTTSTRRRVGDPSSVVVVRVGPVPPLDVDVQPYSPLESRCSPTTTPRFRTSRPDVGHIQTLRNDPSDGQSWALTPPRTHDGVLPRPPWKPKFEVTRTVLRGGGVGRLFRC